MATRDRTLSSLVALRGVDRLGTIASSGLATTLKVAARRTELAALAFEAAAHVVTRESLDLLGGILASAKKWPALPIAERGSETLFDPAVLECALGHGVPLAIPRVDATKFDYYLAPWTAREDAKLAEDALALVGAHRWLGAVLVASLLPGGTKRVGAHLDRATRAAGTARVFAGVDAHAAQIAAFGTLASFVPPEDSTAPPVDELWLLGAARPSVAARCPRLVTSIRQITPARLLRNTLDAEKLVDAVNDDDARGLIEFAATAPREADTVMDYGTMQAVLVAAAPTPLAATPALEAAIVTLVARANTSRAKAKARAGKKTKAAGAAKGAARVKVSASAKKAHARIAELASTAASLAPAIERLHARLVDAHAGTTPASTTSAGTTLASTPAQSHRLDESFASIALLLDHGMPWWTLDLGIEVGQQILDAAHYLLDSERTTFVTPAPTAFPWELLITRIGEIMYRVLAPATTKARRAEFADLLALWLASGIPARLRSLRGVDLMVPAAMVSGMDRTHGTRLVAWGNRYFVRYFTPLADGRVGVRALEATRDGVFRVPDGAQLGEHVAAEMRFDDVAIRAVLELVRVRGPVPFDASVSAIIAQRTGLSTAAATLVWTAGYEPWLVGEKKRAELRLERDALDAAERELAKPRLREIYADAMPADPAQMYEPEVLAGRVADAWLVYRAAMQAHADAQARAASAQPEAQGTN